MPYVNVPNDLSKIKTKIAFNLTKRQLICFGIGAAVGVPTYLLTRQVIGNTGAMIAAIMVCAVMRSTGLDTAFFAASSFLAYALLIIVMALLLYLSYRASLSIFRKRRHARSKVAPND